MNMNINPLNIINQQIYRPYFNPQIKNNVYRFSRSPYADSISFTGAQLKDYNTNYDAYCSRLKKYKGFFSSPKDFAQKAQEKYDALVKYLLPNEELNEKYRCGLEWPIGTSKPEKMPITDSREKVIKEWIAFLENPIFKNKLGSHSGENKDEITDTLNIIKNNPSLKLIILDTMITDIGTDNKHISPPINAYALAKTVQELGTIDRNDVGSFSFPNSYQNNMCNLVLNRAKNSELFPPKKRKYMVEAFPCSSGNTKGVWVKIPSHRHTNRFNKTNTNKNVNALEILSHENWCTKNAAYKADSFLKDGDFYVFLEEQPQNRGYKPTIGIGLFMSKISQIQNPSNNDTIKHKYIPIIDFIINKKGLVLEYTRRGDGIPAGRQYEITTRLKDIVNGKTLETAIKENDAESIFQYAGIDYTKDNDGMLVLSRYSPKIIYRKAKVPPILFCELGIDEYALLSKVSQITNEAEFENSKINELPPNLKSLGRKVTTRHKQFSEKCKARFNTHWYFKKTRIQQD